MDRNVKSIHFKDLYSIINDGGQICRTFFIYKFLTGTILVRKLIRRTLDVYLHYRRTRKNEEILS